MTRNGVVFSTDALTLTLHVVREPGDERLAQIRVDENDLHVSVTLKAGDVRGVVLESAAEGPPREIRVAEFQQMHDETVRFWRNWLHRSTYTGRWRETLQRSAITLKLMTYAPSGGLVAAPTTGLPEQVGGERNWDYRYTWVRDASFSVYALLRLGFTEESAQFSQWLRDRADERVGGEGGPLNIMYRVDGSSDLKEESLEHWSGYRGSRPVRIGNGASDQLQLDIYGEALDSIFFADKRGLRDRAPRVDGGAGAAELARGALGPAGGGHLGDPRRAQGLHLRAADELGGVRPGDPDGGRARAPGASHPVDRGARRDLRADHGEGLEPRDAGRSSSTTAATTLDSSLLRMSSVGFISPYDPMWASTLRAMEDELVTDSLVYRYNPEASPDGLQGSEGTFSLCSFMFVDALARAGRLEDARLAFEKMLTYANHVGLFSEEIALSGEQIGNFPQAFTHLALDRRRDHARRGPRPGPSGADGGLTCPTSTSLACSSRARRSTTSCSCRSRSGWRCWSRSCRRSGTAPTGRSTCA